MVFIARTNHPFAWLSNPNSTAIVITGPRQTGKTYLAQTLYPHHRQVSLALPSEAAAAQLDPATFLSRHPPPVVIDDVHLAPRLLQHVADAVTVRPGPPAGYVLVGSRPLTLAAAAESFAVPPPVVRLEGLTYAASAAARPELSLAARILRGGYPALYADLTTPVAEFMRSLVADHLARELPEQLRVDSVHDFERFLRAVALRSGRLLNKAELAREIGIAGSTAAIWLDTLADAGLIALVQPWRPPQGRPLVRTPKLYVTDTGLCSHLMGIRDEDDLAASPHAPALWETFVHGELRSLLRGIAAGAELAFWRDRTKEADFVVPTPRGVALLDVAWTELPAAVTIARMLRIRESFGPDEVAALAVVCRTPHRQALREPAGPVVETVGLDDLPGLVAGPGGRLPA